MLNWALAPRAATLLDQGVDLGVADPDPARDLALAHPLDHHLVLDVGAELRVLDAFAAQPLAQLRQGELVLRGDVGDGAVELGLVDPHAALARVGDEHALVDQHVDHLLAQRRRRRQLGAGLLRLGAHPGEPLLHLGRRDQLLVDHGDDVVAGLRRRRARPPGRAPAPRRRPGRGGGQISNQSYGVNGRARGALVAQQLVAGHIVLQDPQRIGADPGKADEFQLHQQPGRRFAAAGGQPLDDHPADPAAGIVFQAQEAESVRRLSRVL